MTVGAGQDRLLTHSFCPAVLSWVVREGGFQDWQDLLVVAEQQAAQVSDQGAAGLLAFAHTLAVLAAPEAMSLTPKRMGRAHWACSAPMS